jgi:hypothetical protein
MLQGYYSYCIIVVIVGVSIGNYRKEKKVIRCRAFAEILKLTLQCSARFLQKKLQYLKSLLDLVLCRRAFRIVSDETADVVDVVYVNM